MYLCAHIADACMSGWLKRFLTCVVIFDGELFIYEHTAGAFVALFSIDKRRA